VNLTRRQQDIYEFLLDAEHRWADPPTLDELCEALGLRSRGSLHKHIQALVEAELIEPFHGKHRGVRLRTTQGAAENAVPYLGKIAAGVAVQAFEVPETIEVPGFMLGSQSCFVLQAKGDSMINAGILDGDLLVIERRSTARNHDIVVALVQSEESTLKRIEQTPGEVLLHPENPAFEVHRYVPDEVQIQGVVVGQMRTYR